MTKTCRVDLSYVVTLIVKLYKTQPLPPPPLH
jgi:hypothetical protein